LLRRHPVDPVLVDLISGRSSFRSTWSDRECVF